MNVRKKPSYTAMVKTAAKRTWKRSRQRHVTEGRLTWRQARAIGVDRTPLYYKARHK